MKEMYCTDSLFGLPRYSDEAVVVTTNGVIRKNGDGVMGAGRNVVLCHYPMMPYMGYTPRTLDEIIAGAKEDSQHGKV